jgi:hypothetical protein
MSRLILFTIGAVGLIAGSACSSSRADTPAVPGTLYIIAIDVSGSRTATQLSEGTQLVNGLIARMTNGDNLVLVQTYQAGNGAAKQWAGAIPAAATPGHPTGGALKKAQQFKNTAQMLAGAFFDSTDSKHVMTTDLLFTIGRAADYAKSARGRRTTLVIMSDMLNSTPELTMDGKNGVVPNAAWIDARKAHKQLPDLRGVCVVVDGADVSTARGAAVRAFWQAYFAAAGTQLPDENYRNMISDAGQVGCG